MIHVLGMPHIQVSKRYCRDAYGMKILKFCQMMINEGHNVTLYASEENETPATLVTCITKKEQSDLGFNGPEDYLKNDFDPSKELWKIFHARAIKELKLRVKPGDIIGTFSGRVDSIIAEQFPECYFVELGIGYSGVFADYRVYESYAWMHANYGSTNQDTSKVDGRFYDTVIPNYYDISEFPFKREKGDYFLFMGRMIYRKGIKIIEDIANRMPESKFIMVGQGAKQEGRKIVCDEMTLVASNIEYIRPVDIKRRGELMSNARALIVPTLYIGPFEGVQVEANLCGTPTITTNFGAFTENNPEGLTGYRCSTIKQFVDACNRADELDYDEIRNYAQSRFSMKVVGPMYTKYFKQIEGLARGGFYEE